MYAELLWFFPQKEGIIFFVFVSTKLSHICLFGFFFAFQNEKKTNNFHEKEIKIGCQMEFAAAKRKLAMHYMPLVI